MTLTYNSENANLTSSFTTLLRVQEAVMALFYEELNNPHMMTFPMITNVYKSTLNAEIMNVIAGPGAWYQQTNEGEEYTWSNWAEGSEVTATPVTYKKAYDVSEELMEDRQFKKIMNNAKSLARGGLDKQETVGITPYNNAFTSGTGADGSYLCVSDHNLINSTSTGDNALTTELSVQGVIEAYELAGKVVGDDGIYSRFDYDTILVPVELEAEAWEIFMSDERPDTTNRAKNFLHNKVKRIIVSPYLTSATAWFLIASGAKDILPAYVDRVSPMFRSDVDVFSDNLLFKGRMRATASFAAWQGVIGSTGEVAAS